MRKFLDAGQAQAVSQAQAVIEISQNGNDVIELDLMITIIRKISESSLANYYN